MRETDGSGTRGRVGVLKEQTVGTLRRVRRSTRGDLDRKSGEDEVSSQSNRKWIR